MDENRLHHLLQKFLSDACSPAEKQELALLIDRAPDDSLKAVLAEHWGKGSGVTMPEEVYARIVSRTKEVMMRGEGEARGAMKRDAKLGEGEMLRGDVKLKRDAMMKDGVADERVRGMFSGVDRRLTEAEADVAILKGRGADEQKGVVARDTGRLLYLRRAAVAAAVIVLCVAGYYYWPNLFDHGHGKPAPVVAQAVVVSPASATTYTRSLVLADGSRVLLKEGSTLNDGGGLGAHRREVTLTGEAYFDIATDAARPFIIHTGKVKTTVLGTSFNILAWPNDKRVTVAVTSGRVRVENELRVLATLSAGELVRYDAASAQTVQKPVTQADVTKRWSPQDLQFNGESFASIADVLSKRYGVAISVADEQLAKTKIVSSFAAAEPLDSILSIVCTINNASFVRTGNTITITKR